MQITAFEAILARRINIKGCEDYENTFAHMESDCMLRFGFKALINSISCTHFCLINFQRRVTVHGCSRQHGTHSPRTSLTRTAQLEALFLAS